MSNFRRTEFDFDRFLSDVTQRQGQNFTDAERASLQRLATGGATSQRGINAREQARTALQGRQPSNLDLLIGAGLEDFNRFTGAEEERAGAVGDVADMFGNELDTLGENVRGQVGEAQEALGGEAQRLQDLGESQVEDFTGQSDKILELVQAQQQKAEDTLGERTLADVQSQAKGIARAAQNRIASIEGDPNIPPEAKAGMRAEINRDFDEQKQNVVSTLMNRRSESLAATQQAGAQLFGQVGTALTGQLLGAQANQNQLNAMASDIRKFSETLAVNSEFEISQLRMNGLTQLADLRERAITSPMSLYALMSTLVSASTSPSARGSGAVRGIQGATA
jgi:hypothetical protein